MNRWAPPWSIIAILGAVLWSCAPDDSGTESAAGARADSTRTDTAMVAQPAELKHAVPVETALALRGDIASYLLFSSTIETEAAVEIYPQLGGLVEAIEVEEGDRVAAGDTLLLIDDDQLRLTARESEVNRRYLEAEYRRAEEMFQRRLISDQEYETQKYEFEQARLRWQRAQLELEYTIIRAPFSGVITERHVQVGGRVGPTTRLFALIKLDDMIARVFVPGQYLRVVAANQPAVITSEFLEGRRFAGRVKRISPVVDPRSGTFKVTVGLRDRWEYLRPGVFVNVQIITATHEDAVLVPKEAVVYDGGDQYVFVVEDSTACRIKLDAGFEDSHFIESLSLIQPDTPVIVVGQNGLKDQVRVKVVNQETRPEAGVDQD